MSEKVTNSGVRDILHNCKKLNTVVLNALSKVTPDVLKDVKPNLGRLAIKYCEEFKEHDESLPELISSIPWVKVEMEFSKNVFGRRNAYGFWQL